MQMSEVWTPVKLIKWSEKYFADKKTDSPRLTSELLLAHVLKWQRVDLYTKFEYELSPEELKNYKELLLRRTKGEPLQYLIGETQFLDLKIKVSNKALIPRPETEQVLLKFVDLIKDTNNEFNIVDLGTGTGILALKIAQYFPGKIIYGVDIDPHTLEQAKLNQENLKINNINWCQGDFLEALPKDVFEKPLMIIANPPYLSQKEFEEITIELKHEPSKALLAGPTGLEAYEKILKQMKEKCLPGSSGVFEIGESQGTVLSELFKPSFKEVDVFKDLSEKNRILHAVNLNPIQ